MKAGAHRFGFCLTLLLAALVSGCDPFGRYPQSAAPFGTGATTGVTPTPVGSHPAGFAKYPATYPTNWWTPVPTNGVPAWEVLPQEAKPGEVILSKRNELGLLSNFAPTPFEFHGKRYASLEGFWQMMKYPEGPDDVRATASGLTWPRTREEVASLTAFDAKRAGDAAEKSMKQLGITWVTFEGKRMEYREPGEGEFYKLIAAATHEKVRQNPEVEEVLLSTGNLTLRPDHHQSTNSPPAWHYFDILMQIRAELQADRAEKH